MRHWGVRMQQQCPSATQARNLNASLSRGLPTSVFMENPVQLHGYNSRLHPCNSRKVGHLGILGRLLRRGAGTLNAKIQRNVGLGHAEE